MYQNSSFKCTTVLFMFKDLCKAQPFQVTAEKFTNIRIKWKSKTVQFHQSGKSNIIKM